MDEDGGDDRKQGQPVATGAAVTLFQEIGQGRDIGADVERGKKQGENNQSKGGHPLEVSIGQAVRVAFFGKTD